MSATLIGPGPVDEWDTPTHPGPDTGLLTVLDVPALRAELPPLPERTGELPVPLLQDLAELCRGAAPLLVLLLVGLLSLHTLGCSAGSRLLRDCPEGQVVIEGCEGQAICAPPGGRVVCTTPEAEATVPPSAQRQRIELPAGPPQELPPIYPPPPPPPQPPQPVIPPDPGPPPHELRHAPPRQRKGGRHAAGR